MKFLVPVPVPVPLPLLACAGSLGSRGRESPLAAPPQTMRCRTPPSIKRKKVEIVGQQDQ